MRIPLEQLRKEKREKEAAALSEKPKATDSWSDIFNRVANQYLPTANQAEKKQIVSRVPVASKITKWQDEYQPTFEKAFGDKYNWESFSNIARAINGRYDDLDIKDTDFTNFVANSKQAAISLKNYYNNPTENNKKEFQQAYNESLNFRSAVAKKFTASNINKYNYIFDVENSSFKNLNKYNRDNNDPEYDYTKSNNTAKVYDKNDELISEIENKNTYVYYSNHEREKAVLQNKSLNLLNPVHQSWNTYALNNLEKGTNSDTKKLAYDLIQSELQFISKNGTVGSSRKQDQNDANVMLQKMKGLSYAEQTNFLKTRRDKINNLVNNMGYYGKLVAVKSYRKQVKDISWFNAGDSSKSSEDLFEKIQEGSYLDKYRTDYNDFLKFDKNTRKEVINAMQSNWEDDSVKFDYTVGNKKLNDKYLNALITQGDDESSTLNLNSFDKFLKNVNPAVFDSNVNYGEDALAKRIALGQNTKLGSGGYGQIETSDFILKERLKNELKIVYNGMSKAFKKTYDNAKVSTKISDSFAFNVVYKSVDFTVDSEGFFKGNTDKKKQKDVVLPIYDLLKNGDDFTNSKAVLFSNSEIEEGLFAIQSSDILKRMNSSSMLKMKKQDGTIAINESDYEDGKKTVKYDAVNNKKILDDFLNSTKDPSDIELTYLKNTNAEGFVSFIFENKEGKKMQMFVPKENVKNMPLYKETKSTAQEKIFSANGNKQELPNQGAYKNVFISVNDKNLYQIQYTKNEDGNIKSYKYPMVGYYKGAVSLSETLSRANGLLRELSKED